MELSEWSVMSGLCGGYLHPILSFPQIFVQAPLRWRILVVLYRSRWGCEMLFVVVLEWLVVMVVVGFVVLVLHQSTGPIRICFPWGCDLSLWFCRHHKVLSMQGGTKHC